MFFINIKTSYLILFFKEFKCYGILANMWVMSVFKMANASFTLKHNLYYRKTEDSGKKKTLNNGFRDDSLLWLMFIWRNRDLKSARAVWTLTVLRSAVRSSFSVGWFNIAQTNPAQVRSLDSVLEDFYMYSINSPLWSRTISMISERYETWHSSLRIFLWQKMQEYRYILFTCIYLSDALILTKHISYFKWLGSTSSVTWQP